VTDRLDSATLSRTYQALQATVLTGVHPFAGDPFQRQPELEVVGEELNVWTDAFPARLHRATGAATVLVMSSVRGPDDRLLVSDGWELPLVDPGRSWWEVASEVDLVHNGLEFVLSDASASWAILVLPDAQLVAGHRPFIRAYFGGDLGTQEAAQVFLSQVSAPEGYEEFRRLATYLRIDDGDGPPSANGNEDTG
jgi:hypothetical protein